MTGIQVYLEPFGPPARHRLQRLIEDAKGGDSLAPVTIVPPNSYAGTALRRILAGSAGLLNVRFMPSARLAEFLGARVMADQNRNPLSPAAEIAIIRSVAAASGRSGMLGPFAHHPALHRSLRDTFRDLARLTVAELDTLAALQPLQAETVRLFRRFQERTTLYYHPEDVKSAAVAAVKSGAAGPALRDIGAVVWFLPAELSPVETELALALDQAGAGCSMVLGLTGEPDADAPAQSLALSFGGPVHTAPRNPADLSPLHAETIVSAPDVREEVRHALRDMLTLAQEGIPFHRMAALYRQPDPYARQLRMELDLAGVPVAGPDPETLALSPAGRLILGFLDLVEADFSRPSLTQWVAEAPVRTGSGGRQASADLFHWESVSRKAGVVRGLDQWRQRLGPLAAMAVADVEQLEDKGELSPGLARTELAERDSAARLLQFVEALSAAAPPRDGSPWNEFCRWARQAMTTFGSDPSGWPDGQPESQDRVLTEVDELRELDLVDGGTTLAVFRQTLDQVLDVPIGRSGATGSGVFVAGLDTVRGMEFDSVWIFGMAEGTFPPRSQEDPLLPDSARRAVGDGRIPLRRVVAADERLSYLAALSAGKRRFLSYSRTNPRARRAQHPAPWLLDAAGMRRGDPVSSEELTMMSEPWLSVIESPQHSLAHAANGKAIDEREFGLVALDTWRACGGRLRDHPLVQGDGRLRTADRLERSRFLPDLTEWDGWVGSVAAESSRLAGMMDRPFSPTRLENWAKCPYRFFLGNVLNLSAWQTPEDLATISPLDRGTLVHEILDRFIQEALEHGPPAPADDWPPQHAARLLVIAEEEFSLAEQRGVTGWRVLWEGVKDEIRRDLQTFLEEDAARRALHGVQPWQTERPFGFGDSPVTLPLPSGETVSFRGKIDRVDVSPDRSRALVMDYKTGSLAPYRDMAQDPLAAGTHLQLPVYALAVRDALLASANVAAEYWFVSARGAFESRSVSLDDVESAFRETVQTIVEGIKRGVFPANPGPAQSNCTYCDFQRICPASRLAIWERKQSSPLAGPYSRLTAPPSDPDTGDGEP